ncbi:MAG: hypothetical protein JKY48_02185 [Flavobacteriales bacterium]|nr:hypothetical protein [Flavobacteriales bacterium]
MKKLVYFIAITSFFACGAEVKKDNAPSEVKAEAMEESIEVVEEKELIEIKVAAIGESMSEIAFEPTTLSIPSNTRIKLTLENKSSAAGMLHNFVLVELGSGAEISSAGIKAGKKNNFVPKDKRVIAYTKIAQIGETITVEFDAPAKGSYHYICTYPGHISMVGRLNVE